ncbi:hypothetical protein SAMN05216559_3249 [Halomicrobium zhouii]|uniref:Uncharacterized protein n=1 Tax=Halomicrobium zhouii TaxID=767519 RepID=A0A1I6LW16_9EURY|nr:hypothetical protein [Halomicrobium zhouii]SFS07590.1 hypothetical protein SAMN05216559_3249 [Halomicrobium zhouii]
MRSFEVSIDDETARSLAIEADLLEFETVESYLAWVVEQRFSLEGDGMRHSRLAAFASEVRRERSGDVRSDDSTTDDVDLSIDGAEDAVARIEDEELTNVVESLADVERERVDAFARRAVAQTSDRLGERGWTAIDYDPRSTREEGFPGDDVADVASIDVPGHDEELCDRRRWAVGAALCLLREQTEAKRGDFVDELYEELPAGYGSEDAWWGCIKTGLRQISRVEPARDGAHVWRYRTTPGRVTRISFSDDF